MLRTSLNNPGEFTFTYELVPGQSCCGKRIEQLLDFARAAKADGRIKALSVTDNPGGNSSLAPAAIGEELLKLKIEPLLHFSLKDKNRSQIVSHIYLYQRLGLRSLLVMGGDFPKPGYYGQARPVFDLDSTQTLQLMQEMATGLHPGCILSQKRPYLRLFKGCVVSPFKATEAEQVWQYANLLRKVRAGADFIVSQLGFDVRKFAELITLLRRERINLPVLANVFIPSLGTARAMAAGKVPGVLLSQELLARMEQEAAAGDNHARLDRAAAMIVRLKRYGCQGVHLGGSNLRFEEVSYVLDRYAQWDQETELPDLVCDFPLQKTWYFYRKEQGLSQETLLKPGLRRAATKFPSLSHQLLFSQSLSSRLFGRFCLFCSQGKRRTTVLILLERAIKRLLFNCRMCGDCTLSRSAFLCPQSGCPKRLINGPCGGSRLGFCEVHPERLCFWVRVYERLDPQTTLKSLAEPPHLPPKDWALEKTSAWINFFKQQREQEEPR
ncbi:methylenetetrahydrofolate reductase C-terminal domain-containing protein [Candidatus Electronema sp. PJ]|uniref:methylenetetrahydrofolate reductase C-terminal domain-containing protein n=1 Tax=Candidatus Electronema sp. PJ TaxID=3401572 RepID=UPI003AA8D7EA